ncbi:MAG: hypothetical protein PHQ23_06080 [Candidatus Wallbacteria bacterium]|nr:hypothetical protein [Candidatus Wallbacteria bacterium]
MKFSFSATLIIVSLAFTAFLSASDIVPPHGYMPDARGLVVPKSYYPSHNLSPSHDFGRALRPAPTGDLPPITNHQLPITDYRYARDSGEQLFAPTLGSIKALINTSLWIYHLSHSISSTTDAEAVEQVYTHSLDEIERKSASLAELIVDGLKEKKDGYFREFVEVFRRSSENEKNGFSILALKIEECLSQAGIKNRTYDYHAVIRDVISQSQSATVSFSESSLSLKDLINRLGLYIVGMHATALEEFMHSGDSAEYTESVNFTRKAFAVLHLAQQPAWRLKNRKGLRNTGKRFQRCSERGIER